MYEETNSLDEVVIKANLPKYKLTNDGIRTKVSGTTLSKAGTASDVLRSLPLVKEEDEGFSIFGKGTPSIYVNGRLIRDLTELEKIKSDDIKNVEVITEPGARYDASVSCVIKIKTVSFNGEGWGFSMYSDYFQADKEDAAVQLDVNYIRNKLDMFATVRFNHDNYWTKSVVNQAVFVDTLWNQNNFMLAEGRRQNAQTSLGMNYHINDSNIIGTRLQIGWHIDNDETTRVESMVFANDAFYDRWKNRENKTFSNPPQFDYNFFYEGKAGKFTFDYNFDILIGGNDVTEELYAVKGGKSGTYKENVWTEDTNPFTQFMAGKPFFSNTTTASYNSSITTTVALCYNQGTTANDTTALVFNRMSSDNKWETRMQNLPLPNLKNVTMIYYDGKLYAFGGESVKPEVEPFSQFYCSTDNGLCWRPVTECMAFPAEFGTLYTTHHGNYSCAVTPKLENGTSRGNFIWIVWEDGSISRGRINRLGFTPKW